MSSHHHYTTRYGTFGTDFSVNPATVPISGYTLLTTIGVHALRNSVGVQNQSASQVQVVRDDGNGNNQTTILLSAAASAGAAGGFWSSDTFKGRVRVYGPSGSEVSAYED